MPPKSNKGKAEVVEEEEDIIQAVVLADSFNHRFKPLSTNKPRTLIPLCNIPLLDWTLESLVSSGVQDIIVFCCSHAEQIKEAINASRWSLPNSGVRITPIVTPEARSIGDVMRELDAKQIITSDFILVTGDIVSNLPLMAVVEEHKNRRKVSKNCIMTMVMKPAGNRDRPRPGVDTPTLLLNAETLECLHYEYVPAGTPTVSFPRDKVSSVLDLDVRIDLLDCSIDICSVDVPALFTENFDYQDLRVDFVHGVLTSDILGKTIYCHIPKRGYAARVKNTRTYSNITRDVLARRTFPLVPDDTPAYKHRTGNVYLADPSLISRTSTLGSLTQVGPRTTIEGEVILDGAVIGADCVVGAGAVIRNSIIWDGVHIGSGTLILDSIVAGGVKIGPNSRIARGSLIGEGTILGKDASLPEFSKVSGVPPLDEDWDDEDDDQAERAEKWALINPKVIGAPSPDGPAIKVYRWPREDEKVDDEDDEDAEGEHETIRSRKYNRLGYHDSDVDESDAPSVASSTPESTPSSTPTSTAALSEEGDDADITSLSLDDTPAGFSDSEFRSECTQSLDRAFEEGHSVANAAIELKTLRMASNVPLTAVKEVVIAFLVSKIPLKLDVPAQKKEVAGMITRWGGLLGAIGLESPVESIVLLQAYCARTPDRLKLFPTILAEFYNDDIIESEDVIAWLRDPRAKYPANTPGETCFKQGLALLQAIKAAESSSSDEDDESDGEEEEEDDGNTGKGKAAEVPRPKVADGQGGRAAKESSESSEAETESGESGSGESGELEGSEELPTPIAPSASSGAHV